MNDRKDVCVLSVTSKSKWTEKIALPPCSVVDSFLSKGQHFFIFIFQVLLLLTNLQRLFIG